MKALLAVAVGFMFLVGASVGVSAQDDAVVKKDKELLKGTWKIESLETPQGKQDDIAGATMTFDDDKVEFKKGDETKKATITLNPAGKPKEITFKTDDKTMEGIYRVEKETLSICLAVQPGAARPNEFAAKDQYVLVTLKKEK
jgi:uncharacterized protein (TIGR03067 family)